MHNIAVSGLNAGDSPAPGIPVIRCLREIPHRHDRIIGLAYDALESGLLDSSMVDAAYLMPYPKSGKDTLLERLQQIHKKEHIDVIIPTLDSEILNYIYLRNVLSDMGIKLLIPSKDQFEKRTKINLGKLSEEAGIKTPKTLIITDLKKIDLKQKDFPVIVKGIFYEAYIANTTKEVMDYAHKITSRWGYPILIQECIEGEEFNAVALSGQQAEVLGIVCMKKLVLTDRGKGWVCVSIKNESLMEFSCKILKALNWTGPAEIEAIYSKKDDCFYLIEVNPRFPAWTYLAKAAGINLPYLYLQVATGETVIPTEGYETGVVFSNYTTNIITKLQVIESLFTNGEIQYEKNI